MSNEVEFNSLTGKDEVKVKLEQPSRVPQKPSDEEVAKYSKTRMVLVVLFGLIIIAMIVAAVIIIIVAPKCSKITTINIDKNWWKREIIYQVYPRSFKDSNGDGNGDLRGILDKLDYLEGLGVKILWLNSIYKSPMVDNGYDVEDYEAINEKFGNMSDFDELIKKAHDKGMKIVMDFVPNHTSNKHKWFKESSLNKTNSKRNWYVWKDSPNNWLSVINGSAWEKDSTTNQLYLHQFTKEEPDLNLREDAVVDALKDVLKFWTKRGVDGFRVDAVQYMLEDVLFRNDAEKTNYNTSGLQYNMTTHNSTYDLPGNHGILKKFRDALNAERGSYKVLISDVAGSNERIVKFYNESDFPFFFGLISGIDKANVASSVNKTVTEFLATVPKGKWPNFVIGNDDSNRVGTRLGDHLIDAMNVLLLTLPGTPTTYYGEEIGMVDTNATGGTDKRNPERTPMQWNDGANAGFTNGSKPWLQVNTNKATINVATQKKNPKSHYSIYKTVAKLRRDDTFNTTEMMSIHVDSQVFAYMRGNKRDSKYLVVINFSKTEWNGDLSKLSGHGIVKFDSKFEQIGETVDVNKLKLKSGRAIIIKLVKYRFI